MQRFEGVICSKQGIPYNQICYALLIDNERWLLPLSDARYINHSCEPNCIIDDNLNVITIKSIQEGEELTISYNLVYENENPGEWDARWNFNCQCGSKNCQGLVDKYIAING